MQQGVMGSSQCLWTEFRVAIRYLLRTCRVRRQYPAPDKGIPPRVSITCRVGTDTTERHDLERDRLVRRSVPSHRATATDDHGTRKPVRRRGPRGGRPPSRRQARSAPAAAARADARHGPRRRTAGVIISCHPGPGERGRAGRGVGWPADGLASSGGGGRGDNPRADNSGVQRSRRWGLSCSTLDELDTHSPLAAPRSSLARRPQ